MSTVSMASDGGMDLEDVVNTSSRNKIVFTSIEWAVVMIVVAYIAGAALATGIFFTSTMRSLFYFGLVFLVLGGSLTAATVIWYVLYYYYKSTPSVTHIEL